MMKSRVWNYTTKQWLFLDGVFNSHSGFGLDELSEPMLSTGCRDYMGTEIYEGDIDHPAGGYPRVVSRHKAEWGLRRHADSDYMDKGIEWGHCGIVGNVIEDKRMDG